MTRQTTKLWMRFKCTRGWMRVGTYFGLFNGDVTVTLGETASIAHRIADGGCYCIGGGGGGGGGKDRQYEVPLQQRDGRRSHPERHDGAVKVQALVLMRFCRVPNGCTRASVVCNTRRLQPITIRDGDGCVSVRRRRRRVFQTTPPPLPPPQPPPPPTPMPKTADRSSNPPTHPPIRVVIILFACVCASVRVHLLNAAARTAEIAATILLWLYR